ncbi:hypothetical protein J2W32_000065 [Variovorax boronicumulans]|uniref:Uncharacterized protein n=1 Tax=Variovorax boronicumulans TaxID=436515 RepID=A0AAW8CRV2_9BURK|nr:hypothetical protein [Variovorax boronicumulans]MDP9890969.1 hypothetical protein [Variovorax boronicumulans]MDQ0051036.1 hypothetical protein [Variovorax boronicumulans]
MRLSLTSSLEAPEPVCATSSALARWYAEQSVIRRLWAIQSSDGPTLRVIVMLEPSPDGDEISPAWMAHGSRWARDLRERLADAVQLERIDGPLPDEFEIDGEGAVLTALCWRDSTAVEA